MRGRVAGGHGVPVRALLGERDGRVSACHSAQTGNHETQKSFRSVRRATCLPIRMHDWGTTFQFADRASSEQDYSAHGPASTFQFGRSRVGMMALSLRLRIE